jgi:hypothetical protein
MAQEIAKLDANEVAGIAGLGVRDQLILKLVADSGSSSLTIPAGKILVGSATNTALPVTPTGVVALSNAGVVSFSTNFAFAATSGTNGEIAVSGMTTNGAVVITPMEACPAVHVVAAAGKVTVFEANTTNVINAKKLAVLILAK